LIKANLVVTLDLQRKKERKKEKKNEVLCT
jgi:hypothetical protein